MRNIKFVPWYLSSVFKHIDKFGYGKRQQLIPGKSTKNMNLNIKLEKLYSSKTEQNVQIRTDPELP